MGNIHTCPEGSFPIDFVFEYRKIGMKINKEYFANPKVGNPYNNY